MNEQEQKAIKWMQNVRDDAVVTLDHIAKEEPNVSPMLYAGRKEKAETIINGFEELERYREIGTVGECRAAVEKQRAKKPIIHPWSPARCPTCGEELSGNLGDGYYRHRTFLERCTNVECGQKLDWSGENEE